MLASGNEFVRSPMPASQDSPGRHLDRVPPPVSPADRGAPQGKISFRRIRSSRVEELLDLAEVLGHLVLTIPTLVRVAVDQIRG